jgi:hypothetical protein
MRNDFVKFIFDSFDDDISTINERRLWEWVRRESMYGGLNLHMIAVPRDISDY